MIYLLYGENTEKAREKMHGIVDSLRKKKPDAAFLTFNVDTFKKENLDELIGGQGLFSQKNIVVLDSVCEDREVREVLLEKVRELAQSENIFVILEKKLDKAMQVLDKHAEKSQEFAAAVEKKFEANMFALADALGMKDKKKLWVLFDSYRSKGAEAEEIHGILFWQVKSMLLASQSSSASESGLSPFAYSKSARYAKGFSKDELAKMLGDLVKMYHDAHRGVVDFMSELERWVLNL